MVAAKQRQRFGTLGKVGGWVGQHALKALIGAQQVAEALIDRAEQQVCFEVVKGASRHSRFASSISHFLNFKLPVECSTQPQPLQDILL